MKRFYTSALLIALCIVTTTLTYADTTKTADLLSDKTIALLEIPDVNAVITQYKKTDICKITKLEAMKPFTEDVKKRWNKMFADEQNPTLKNVLDGKILPKSIALALILDEKALEKGEPTAVIISNWDDKIEKFNDAINQAVDTQVSDGAHLKTRENRDVNIKTLTAPESERLPYGLAKQISYCTIDNMFLLSEDDEQLDFVIAHLKGAEGQNLAENSDYEQAIKTVDLYSHAKLYINIAQLIKIAIQSEPEEAEKNFTNLGVNNVKSFACSLGIAAKPTEELATKATLLIQGEKKGICKILDLESTPLNIPDFAPVDALSFSSVNFDVKKAFEQLVNILSSYSPQFAAALYTPLVPAGPGASKSITLKNDIIDNLGTGLLTFSIPTDQKDQPPKSFFCLKASNPDALERSLAQIHKAILGGNDPDAKRQLLGHTIYKVNAKNIMPLMGLSPFATTTPTDQPPGSPAQPAAAPMPPVCFTIADSWLLLGGENTLENALRKLETKDTQNLSQKNWVKIAKANIPAKTGSASAQNFSQTTKFIFNGLKKATKEGHTFNFGPVFFAKEQGDLFDPALLPEFDAISKYLGIFANYTKTEDFGFSFNAKYLKQKTD
jgi:hypothetical protein